MTPSERAALGWIVAGIAVTWLVQSCTAGEHSVSAGLRAHPVGTGILVGAFTCHLAQRPRCFVRFDPFHLAKPRRFPR